MSQHSQTQTHIEIHKWLKAREGGLDQIRQVTSDAQNKMNAIGLHLREHSQAFLHMLDHHSSHPS